VTENGVDLVNRQLVAMATSFNGSQNNLRSFIYRQRSATAAHFANIGLVNVDIVILVYKKSLNYFKNTSETYSPRWASLKPGVLITVSVPEWSIFKFSEDSLLCIKMTLFIIIVKNLTV